MTVNREINFKEIPVRMNKTIKDVLEIYSRLQVPRQALMEDYLAVITTKYIDEAHNP